jgi:hypothetical protein
MKLLLKERRIVLAFTLLAAGLCGVGVFSLVVRGARLGAGFPLAALAMDVPSHSHCEDGRVSWARSLLAYRDALGEDDFDVEAAFTVSLLRPSGIEQLSLAERTVLLDAAARCPSVLHVPCDDSKFEQAVARRCNPPKRAVHGDAGVSRSEAGAHGEPGAEQGW